MVLTPELQKMKEFEVMIRSLLSADKYVARKDYTWLRDGYKDIYITFSQLASTGMLNAYCETNHVEQARITQFLNQYSQIAESDSTLFRLMPTTLQIRNSTAEFLIFQLEDKANGIEVFYKDETLWASQKAIAALFDVERPAITKHLNNIFDSGELDRNQVCSKMEHTAEDGKTYNTQFYNLDAIISVGYHVNSRRATQFRQWATAVLRTFAVRGYVLDKKRLENGSFLGEDYFEHLLAEIREIRLSERRLYQKLTEACRCRKRIYGTDDMGECA